MTEKIKQTLKDSPLMRWFIMVLVSGLTFSTYWFQDFYSGLKPLMESQMGITSSEFGTLIGLTTIANVFGMIIKINARALEVRIEKEQGTRLKIKQVIKLKREF